MPPLPSVDEARSALLAAVRPLAPVNLPVADVLGLVLAEEVTAAHDVPAFANSAMDGFATRGGRAGERLRVVGESRAGTPFDGTVEPGQAVRISTGAALPDGADGVLQLERVQDDGDTVTLGDDVPAGRNVRAAGDDLKGGSRVLRAGTRVGPAELGVAIGAGRMQLLVHPRPRLAVVTTGDELVPPGTPLRPGQIHDSNGPTLSALAARAGAEVVGHGHAVDDPEATQAVIAGALDAADVLVLAGGVSVGPHDHVKASLDALGVREILWRVALKPGKPTWLGERDGKLVLGLPGNPVSAYVTFLLFARPALNALQGADAAVPRSEARLAAAVPRNPDRDELIRVRRTPDGTVEPTGPQGSHVLSSLLGADGLAIVPRGEGELPAGATVVLEPV
ncbi:MAG TPA: gephyrin-like molybdotransferase Glp [Baekduia sp.]|uniref:molybdopterin molybdotransferase MoeA n=1 Tax=Baekduia sp. TaxID=2600305 RepID=UPI002D77FD9E|nr:gephyrin-like molybdotransferase Glp [Baekduia sp.]HET6506614.1 gephyrin-like molybdotransferase Glp [Baekduia sp.]